MTIASNFLHTFRILNQGVNNLIQLQRDVVNNAGTWKAMAMAQEPSVEILSGYMRSAANSYSTRLGWVATLQANTALWLRVRNMWTSLGGTAADFSSIITPLNTVSDQLLLVNLSTYPAIIAACDQIIAAINMPDSLWPE